MNRTALKQTMSAINLMRQEKTPPIATYCIMLAIASGENRPMGITEIQKMLDETSFGGGSMERMVEKGLLLLHKDGRNNRYTLTVAGWDEVKRLIAGQRPPTAQEKRKASIVPFNPNAIAS